MASVNEELREQILSHQIGLQRLANAHVKKALAMLTATERRFARDLRRRLRIAEVYGYDPGPVTTARLRRILADLRATIVEGYATIGKRLEEELLELTEYEVEYMRRAVVSAIPDEVLKVAALGIGKPTAEQLAVILSDEAFIDGVFSDYFRATGKQSLAARQMREYGAVLREYTNQGILGGESIETVVRRLQRRVRSISRRHLRVIVDSATKHVSQRARQMFLEANSGDDGVVKGYTSIGTLDLNICVICVPRDGKRWNLNFQPIGHDYPWNGGPGRWHPGDRCATGTWLKSWKELGIDRKELSGQSRASMDGEQPQKMTAEEWLRGKSPEQVAQVFGKRKAKAFLDGDLSLRRMVRVDGEVATLAELDLD